MFSFKFFVTLGASAVALSTFIAACGGAPGAEGTESSSQAATEQPAVATPICDPAGRPPAGEHWDLSLCEWVPNCVDNVLCVVGAHWDPETCSCEKNCTETEICRAPAHWSSSVCHCVE